MRRYELIISSKCVDIYTPHTMLSVLPGPYLFILTKTLGVAYDLPLFWDGTAELYRGAWQSHVTKLSNLCVSDTEFESDSPLQSLCISSPSTCPTSSPEAWVHFVKELEYRVCPLQLWVLFKKVKHLSTDVWCYQLPVLTVSLRREGWHST